MSASLTDERADRLAGEPASVSRARRLVADALEEWGLDVLVMEATLLVSEVVTNAVLHAGTDIELRVRRSDRSVRIEVADGSPVMPAARTYDDDAVTGRGLRILESTAAAWGATGEGVGKVVWFDLGDVGTVGPTPGEVLHAVGSHVVRWEGLPARLAKATLEHGDAMLRELALLSFDEDAESLAIAPIVTPSLDLTALLAALDAAIASGDARIDVEVQVAPGADDAALSRLALVDEADRMAHDGALLIPAALPEIISCRHWLMTEIVAQVQGGNATSWLLPDPPPAPGDWEPLTDEEAEVLGDALPDSMVVDQQNRIVFVGDRAAHVVGWTPADLVGRRLTDIVPPELREAHLVGFTRYHVTGSATLLGRPLDLRARRASGDDVDVTITLDVLPRLRGRYRHRALLETR